MATYSTLTIELTFEKIWESWLNKQGESSARKSVGNFLRSGNNKDELLKACEAYVLESVGSDPKFTYKLSNFVNLDHWRDVLENVSLDKLRKKKEESLILINSWNDACHSHWIKNIDAETRIGMVQKSLNNKYFKEHWKEALEKANKVFLYKFREGDPREKLKLTLRWFCNTDNDKHTVLKLMEDEYGKPIKEISSKVFESKPIDYEARQGLAKELREMFPSIKFEPPKDPNAKPIQEKLILTPEAVALAELIKSQLGKKPVVQYEKNNISKLASEAGSIEGGNKSTESNSESGAFEFT